MKMFSFWRIVVSFSLAKDAWYTKRADGNKEYHVISFCHCTNGANKIYTFILWKFMMKFGFV